MFNRLFVNVRSPRWWRHAFPMLLGSVVVFTPTAIAVEVAKRKFDLPADAAEKSLKLFSEQSGRGLIAASDIVSGVRTNQVRGEFTPHEALDRMLSGTGLVAAPDERSGSFTVRRQRNDPEENDARAALPSPGEGRPSGASSAASTSSGNEVITLSVFQVNAGADRGYQAGNTVSGSRLNASLKDTPAAISVFTPEFLSDIGANSVTEMLEYATNVEPDFEDANGGFNNPDASDASHSTPTFRIRGMAAVVTADLIETATVQDNYNIERVELSSGPNSVLFGLGSAGGIVALSTKRANLQRDRGMLRTQFGSWRRERYELDLSKVVVPKKLGLRVMGVDSSVEGWRHWDFEDRKSWTAAVSVRPLRGTTLDVSYSDSKYRKHITQPWNAQDQVSLWLASGSPVRDGAAVPASGITALGNANRFTFFEQTGAVANLRGELQSAGHFPVKNGNLLVLLPPDMMPYDYSYAGPGSRRLQSSDDFKATLEHRFSRTLSLELAYLRSASETSVFNVGGADNALFGEPNLTFPALTGPGAVTNPNAGRLYMEAGVNPKQRRVRERRRAPHRRL